MTHSVHDNLFKLVFQRLREAECLLRRVLPRALAARLDWPSLRSVGEQFVTAELGSRAADLVLEVALRGSRRKVWFVIEHKSSRKWSIEVQLHGYVRAVLERSASRACPWPIELVDPHRAHPARGAGWGRARRGAAGV